MLFKKNNHNDISLNHFDSSVKNANYSHAHLIFSNEELCNSNLEISMEDKILQAWQGLSECDRNKKFWYVTDLWREKYLQKVCFLIANLPNFENHEIRGFSDYNAHLCGIIIIPPKPKPKLKKIRRGFGATSKGNGGKR